MPRTNFKELLDAGVHFGHLKRKWSPSMAPYIFMEKNGIHIIDLHKTVVKIDEAANALKQITKGGRKILFVATKKQAKDIVAETVKKVGMPYVTERWPGGMLTNFPTIRKAVKKMSTIDKMAVDGTFDNLSKREKLQIMRQRAKIEKNLGSISDLTRLPAALFVVDISKEYIAVKEAKRLNIPVFGMVDTNSNPKDIDFIIPANDDASKSITLIMEIMTQAIREGIEERKVEKDKEPSKDKKGASKHGDEIEEIDEEIDDDEDIDDDDEDVSHAPVMVTTEEDVDAIVEAAKLKKAATVKKVAPKKVSLEKSSGGDEEITVKKKIVKKVSAAKDGKKPVVKKPTSK